MSSFIDSKLATKPWIIAIEVVIIVACFASAFAHGQPGGNPVLGQLLYLAASFAGVVMSIDLMKHWLIKRTEVRFKRLPTAAFTGAWLFAGFAALFFGHAAFFMNTAYFGWIADPLVLELFVVGLWLIVLLVRLMSNVVGRVRKV